jgi:hypothetical protein
LVDRMIELVVRSTPSMPPMRSVSTSISPTVGAAPDRHQIVRAADRMQAAHLRQCLQGLDHGRRVPRQHGDQMCARIRAVPLVVHAHGVA